MHSRLAHESNVNFCYWTAGLSLEFFLFNFFSYSHIKRWQWPAAITVVGSLSSFFSFFFLTSVARGGSGQQQLVRNHLYLNSETGCRLF